jgi:hypothetical protein
MGQVGMKNKMGSRVTVTADAFQERSNGIRVGRRDGDDAA